MSGLIFTLLRFGFLFLLWLFVLLVLQTIRGDVFGTQVSDRARRASARRRLRSKRPSQTVASRTPRSAPQPSANPHLVVIAGPLAGTTLPLGAGAVTVGRSPDSALVLDDGYASSRHARFYNDSGEWFIEDLNSTNGTYVGRERIYAPTRLTPGLQVTIGKTTLELAL